MDRLRLLTLSLILSGALNIGLLGLFFYSSLEKTTAHLEPVIATPKEQKLYEKIAHFSFPQLLAALTHKEMRELALSFLVERHDFDIARALSHASFEKSPFLLPNGERIDSFPLLSEEEYEAIIQFAYQEKWPFTAKGLFLRLKKEPKKARDPSLEEAFYATKEFSSLELFFQKTKASVSKEKILDLVCDGSWDQLSFFSHIDFQDSSFFSEERRKEFLLGYVTFGSLVAQELLQVRAPSFCEEVNSFGHTPSSCSFREHKVKEGESLWKICRQYHVKLDSLKKANAMDNERIYPGMTLVIPSE